MNSKKVENIIEVSPEISLTEKRSVGEKKSDPHIGVDLGDGTDEIAVTLSSRQEDPDCYRVKKEDPDTEKVMNLSEVIE